MSADLLAAMCLVLVLEGLLLFAAPGTWKRTAEQLGQLEDRKLRMFGGGHPGQPPQRPVAGVAALVDVLRQHPEPGGGAAGGLVVIACNGGGAIGGEGF